VTGPVRIPGGTFQMGAPFAEGCAGGGETPVHEVELPAFLIPATTVTNARFATFAEDSGYVTEAERLGVSAVFHLAFRGAVVARGQRRIVAPS
jgi:formylglycine-generating enzyme required for sulfatase activity